MSMVKLEGGQFNTTRAVAMIDLLSSKAKDRGQSAYIAAEGLYTDGPFDYRQHFTRFNAFGKFNTQTRRRNSKLSLTLSTFNLEMAGFGRDPQQGYRRGLYSGSFWRHRQRAGQEYEEDDRQSPADAPILGHHFTLGESGILPAYLFQSLYQFHVLLRRSGQRR